MAVQAGSARCLELLLTWDVQDPGSGQTGRQTGRDTGERAAHVQQAVCHMVDQDGQTLAHMAAAQHNPVIISTSNFINKYRMLKIMELKSESFPLYTIYDNDFLSFFFKLMF